MHRSARFAAVSMLLLVIACGEEDTPSGSPTPTETPTAAVARTATAIALRPTIDATNAERMRKVAEFEVSAPTGLAWSGDGALRVLSQTGIGEYDELSGRARRIFETGPKELAMAVSANEIAAVAGRLNEPVRLVDLRTGRELRSFAASGTARSVQFFGNNERVMVVTADPITATFWDVPSGQQIGTLTGFDASASLLEIAVSPDGTRAAWMARRTLQFGDVVRGTSGAQQQLNAFVDGYAFAPDSSTFGIAIGPSSSVPEGRVVIWDPATSTTRLSVNGATPFTGVAFSPDSAVLATGGHGLALWSMDDGRRLGSVSKADAGLVRLISFSPDGRTLATVGLDGVVRLWRAG